MMMRDFSSVPTKALLTIVIVIGVLILLRDQTALSLTDEVPSKARGPGAPVAKQQKICEITEVKGSDHFFPRTLIEDEFKSRGQLIGDTCEDVWDNWFKANEDNPYEKPPKEMPDELRDQYTLYGRIPLIKGYYNEKSVPKAVIWDTVDEQMALPEAELFEKSTYKGSTKVVYSAISYFQEYFKGKSGAVIGSQRPWAEVYALRHGAAAVLTVEYQKTKIKTKQPLSWIHPLDLAKNWTNFQEKWDFVISFSSIEHSGLGRYGDTPDPWGDLREVAKMHCLLKPGGVMLLGLPVGDDVLVWNAHRIYGSIRLPWIMQGFKLLGVFSWKGSEIRMTTGFPWGNIEPKKTISWDSFIQPAIILQKVKD